MAMRKTIHKTVTVLAASIENETTIEALAVLPLKAIEFMVNDLEVTLAFCDKESQRIAKLLDDVTCEAITVGAAAPANRQQLLGALYFIGRATDEAPTAVHAENLYWAMCVLRTMLPPFLEFARLHLAVEQLGERSGAFLQAWE